MKRLHIEDNTFDMTVKHPNIAIIADELGRYFIETGAVNHLVMTLFDPATIGAFELTMQKLDRPSPAEANKMLRKALTDVHTSTSHEDAQQIAEKALKALGYLP